MRKNLRFGVIGCGFWADYQIAAWKELAGIELVALYNRTPDRARTLARKYDVPRVYEDAETMFLHEQLDFVDIITDVNTHAHFTEMAARHHVSVICQKPMAASLDEAARMLQYCRDTSTPLYIHENFRWQTPIRKVKQLLEQEVAGEIFKARVSFCSAFPVVANQPFLAELEQFIITDIGSHILDVCRFLFGEADTVYCQTKRVNPAIKGEDVANIFLKMHNGILCFAEMSYASLLEQEVFPQTLLLIEGSKGSIRLDAGYRIHITSKEGTRVVEAPPPFYKWLDPTYAVVHSSIVDCNRNLLLAMQGSQAAETTGEDNFKTVQLVWAAYESARENRAIEMKKFAQTALP